jgi:hypothetical protein
MTTDRERVGVKMAVGWQASVVTPLSKYLYGRLAPSRVISGMILFISISATLDSFESRSAFGGSIFLDGLLPSQFHRNGCG